MKKSKNRPSGVVVASLAICLAPSALKLAGVIGHPWRLVTLPRTRRNFMSKRSELIIPVGIKPQAAILVLQDEFLLVSGDEGGPTQKYVSPAALRRFAPVAVDTDARGRVRRGLLGDPRVVGAGAAGEADRLQRLRIGRVMEFGKQ